MQPYAEPMMECVGSQRSYTAALALLLVGGCVASRPRPVEPSRTTPLAFAATDFVLANGLKVAVLPSRAPHLVSLTLHMAVGAADDPSENPGLAHVAEHMLFAQPYATSTIATELARHAVYHNAETSLDSTDYISTFAPAALRDVIAIEAGRLALRCRDIADADFRHERDVVINELEQRSERSAIRDALYGQLFPNNHPYHRSASGNAKQIAALTQQQVCDFIDRYYAINRATLVVAGPVTEAEVQAALAPLANLKTRRVAARTWTDDEAPIVAQPKPTEISVPMDSPAAVIAWRLPRDSESRARALAVGRMVADRAATECSAMGGYAFATQFGGLNDERFAIVVGGDDVKIDAVLKAARTGIEDTSSWFASFGFEHARERELTNVQLRFESTDARVALATSNLARESSPATGYYREISALGSMTFEQATEISTQAFAWQAAQIVKVTPLPGEQAVASSELRSIATLHTVPRAENTNVADADAPLAAAAPTPTLARTQRTLPNGMNVILLPHGEAPLVHLHLVFGSGTATEGAHRGVASATAALLQPYASFDLLRFFSTGGSTRAFAGTDATVFSATGLAAFVDIHLSGLQAVAVDGGFDDDTVGKYARQLRASASAKTERRANAALAAWTALFGADHPYVSNGAWRTADPAAITTSHLKAFRKRNYTPSNATLIVTGSFDPVLVDKWIDYLFADWTGPTTTTTTVPAPALPSQPTALAVPAAGTQLEVTIAYPGSSDPAVAAAQLVLAEMLKQASEGARTEMGASYGVSASLTQFRSTSMYEVTGSFAPARSTDAVKLIRTRIAAITDGSEQSKRWFIEARRRSAAQAAAQFDTAASVGDALIDATTQKRGLAAITARPQAIAAVTYKDVAALTTTELAPTREVLVVAGPQPAVDALFTALGRKPTWMPNK